MVEPRASNETASYAEEAFVVDVQSFLHHLMVEKGFNRSQLAEAMGVSRARVTQIFSDECKNFTVRLLARAVYALGEKPEIVCAKFKGFEVDCRHEELQELIAPIEVKSLQRWDMGVANDDDVDFRLLLGRSPDRRLTAALSDHARRSQHAPKVAAYA